MAWRPGAPFWLLLGACATVQSSDRPTHLGPLVAASMDAGPAEHQQWASSSSQHTVTAEQLSAARSTAILIATETDCLAESHAHNILLTQRLNNVCSEFTKTAVVINIFTSPGNGSAASCVGELSSCANATLTLVPGMKPTYWREVNGLIGCAPHSPVAFPGIDHVFAFWQVLKPTLTDNYDVIWLVDNDMQIDDFDLAQALSVMAVTGVPLAQPRILGGRKNYWAIGGWLPMSPSGCAAQQIDWVEDEAPFITSRGWRVFYEQVPAYYASRTIPATYSKYLTNRSPAHTRCQVLSNLPIDLFNRTDTGIQQMWCKFLADKLDRDYGCALLAPTLKTLVYRTLDDPNLKTPAARNTNSHQKQLYKQMVEQARTYINDTYPQYTEFHFWHNETSYPWHRGPCVA